MPAEKLLIIGDSGSGKSTSLRNLNPQTTFIINCVGKDLPFRGWKKNYSIDNKNIVNESNALKIKNIMIKINSDEKFKHIKTLIIDDFNYVPAYVLFDKSGETGYSKFTELAKEMKDIVAITEKFRDDLFVVFMMHPDISINPVTGENIIKPKIAGEHFALTHLIAGIS